ncbi:UPF0597 protein [Dissostichus eleginoides]|uniref:UPF0597 protein n=1 Tax=Dissostichus eleginoides TaxID=100907 RepID=A0AAD9CMT2_DISEL|nr:UPF0597 protein [Dissostichus eleginoides]
MVLNIFNDGYTISVSPKQPSVPAGFDRVVSTDRVTHVFFCSVRKQPSCVASTTDCMQRIPQRLTKEKYALGIVTLFPSLQDPHGKTGYEHFYDGQKGGGFLAWRLKSVQRATRLPVRSKHSRIEENGGPMLRREIGHCDDHPDEQRFQELISVMNHTNDREVIMKKMRDTLEYRQRLVHDPDRSSTVLSVFPRLLDTKGLVILYYSYFCLL